MTFISLSEIEQKEYIPGFHGRIIHTERMTLAFWDIEAGAALPAHQHPQEQTTRVVSGRFEMTIRDETLVLESGMMVVIPGDTPHSGKALTACVIEDVFQPIRTYD